MAEYYDTGDPETVKLWSKKLWREFRKADAVFDPKNGFIGEDYTANPFVMIDEAENSAGDRVRTNFIQQLEGRGVIGDAVLEGKEEPPVTSTHDIVIDEQIHGVKTRGKMSQQRVTFDAMKEAKNLLRDWWKRRRAVSVVNHLCGYTVQTDLAYSGLNAPQAPDDQHIYRINQGLGTSNDQTVAADTTATFDVPIVDELVTIAELLTPPIAPFVIDGNEYYGFLLHPDVVADLRDANAEWYKTMQNALQGGQVRNNPIFNRALGMWRNVLFFSEPRITQGVNSSTGATVANTRRCVFFGAGAMQIAYGRRERGSEEHYSWHNGTWDHGRKYYASAGMIWGCNATRFTINGTARDYGKIVVTAYSAPRLTGLVNIDQPV